MLDANFPTSQNKAPSSLVTSNYQSTSISNQKAEFTYSENILIGNGAFGKVKNLGLVGAVLLKT